MDKDYNSVNFWTGFVLAFLKRFSGIYWDDVSTYRTQRLVITNIDIYGVVI